MFLQQFVAICLVLSVVSEQCIRCNVDSENILINSGNITITIRDKKYFRSNELEITANKTPQNV